MTVGTPLPLELYLEQLPAWPTAGRHILAHFDDASIVVYQAFAPGIASFAVEHQRFGGPFSLGRMSWIKPNFLWMMFRSGWATKESQERVLAVRIRRAFFERLLRTCVASSFHASGSASDEAWREAVKKSDVRLQWDPDHAPGGAPLERRALQLGLRGAALAEYAGAAILEIIDVTPMVVAERGHVGGRCAELRMPVERVFVPADPEAGRNVGLSSWSGLGEPFTSR